MAIILSADPLSDSSTRFKRFPKTEDAQVGPKVLGPSAKVHFKKYIRNTKVLNGKHSCGNKGNLSLTCSSHIIITCVTINGDIIYSF